MEAKLVFRAASKHGAKKRLEPALAVILFCLGEHDACAHTLAGTRSKALPLEIIEELLQPRLILFGYGKSGHAGCSGPRCCRRAHPVPPAPSVALAGPASFGANRSRSSRVL